jgi:quercetin dioxygenase-like cupin family protein
MLIEKPVKYGDLAGVIINFEKAGDILPKHVHDETNVHITIVCRGRLKSYSHDWEITTEAGGVIDFKPNEPHELMALEDNTRIINIIKNTSVGALA